MADVDPPEERPLSTFECLAAARGVFSSAFLGTVLLQSHLTSPSLSSSLPLVAATASRMFLAWARVGRLVVLWGSGSRLSN